MPTPQRLPIVNSDDGVWGDIIRQYIAKEHYNDDTDNSINGSHKTITIRPGTTAAGTAPLTFNSGSLMTTPEAGAVEFNTDSLYLTTTTGTVRKKVAIYDDSSGAAGDIYYRDSGGNFVRLPAGSDGNTLTLASGLPAWTNLGISNKVSKSGDTMTGNLVMSGASAQITFPDTTSSSGGILFGADTNLYRSAANTLKTDDNVVVPNLGSLSIASLTNTSYIMSYDQAGKYLAYSPVPKYLWHNLIAFNQWWGQPTFETYNGTWNVGTNNKSLFANREAQAITVINGTTDTAARWTWNSSNIAYSYALWWVLGVAYHGATPSSKNILIETSTDGSSWTTRHTSTGNTSHYTPVWLYASDWGGATYLRLTITITNSQPLCLSNIKALGARWGNQGGGSEYELPFRWDNDGTRLTVGTTGSARSDGVMNLGGTAPTTAAEGLYFGTDTNLYRSAANTLKTDDNLEVTGATYSQGNMTIGSGSTSVGLNVRASSYNGVTVDVYSDTASSYWFLRRTRGSLASPTVVTNNSFLGSFGFRGYADGGMVNQDSARISGYATQDFSTTHGGAIAFYTAANGTSTSSGASQRMTIYHDGNIGIGVTVPTFKLNLASATTAAGGIGFGTDTNLYRSAADTLTTDDAFTAASLSTSGNITVTGTVDGRDVATDGAKLDTIATNADVTDTASVTSAGALMDSELTDLAGVKALDTSTLATLTGTQTLTNKRVTMRVGTATSSATPTINTDNVDAYHLTAQAVDITSFTTNLSGTPTDFQKLLISITGTAARAITWGASFENGPVTLPTTTTSTQRLDVGFIWNAVTGKWRCMASGSA